MKAVKRPATKTRGTEPLLSSSGPASAAPVSSAPTTLELRGVPIHFPFKPYKCQETYMGKVLDALHRSENALLESPTGTGKTLCLLCATLSWQRQQARDLLQNSQSTSELNSQSTTTESKRNRVPTVIYASRTHSQLSQVVRELRNTRYRPRHAVLGSREQMCVNPQVKKANATASDINFDCNRLCKDRKCRFRNNLDRFTAPSNESFQHYQVQSVMDMEDLVAMGTSEKVCPFYFTRSLVPDAELILVPYNYLFDKDAREGTLAEVPWDNSVLIFDEAHNLESFASDSASFDLTSADIAGCMAEITRVIHYVQAMPELADRISLDNLARLKALFMSLEEYMIHRIPEEQRVYSGEQMMEIFRDGMSINHANHVIFLNEVRKLDDIVVEMRSGAAKGNPKLDAFTTCIKRVFGESTEARCLAKARAYRVHISPKEKNGRTISYWCFAPSLAMQELSDLNVRSIIVTSGTLSPLPSYSLELGLPFPHTVENPHIITDNQIHVRVIGRGVSGKLLNSSYNRRDDGEYITELGNTLVSLAKIVPGGMLVFFPSYSVMETCVERWGGPSRKFRPNENKGDKFFQARRRKSASSHQFTFPHAPSYGSFSAGPSTPWKRLLSKKAVILEPKTTSELPDAIADFHKYLGLHKSTGCVLMGVCRGKISEGIDFAHDMCRAVVITGIPFAPYLDPKVKLKREYLDGLRASQSVKPAGDGGFGGEDSESTNPLPITLSGAEWYTQQAHRAVNQAVGRVIRNKSDYGAVLLLDSRFGEERNQQGLSKWVRPHLQIDEGFGQAYASLTKFYREAQRNAAKLSKKDAHLPARGRVLLEYETEGRTNNMLPSVDSMTKIAVVQNLSSDKADSMEMGSQSYVPPDRVIARMELNSARVSESSFAVAVDQCRQSATRSNQSPMNTLDAVYRKRLSRSNLMTAPSATSESAWSNLNASRKDSDRLSSNIEARRALRETMGNARSHLSVEKVSKKDSKSDAVVFFEKVRSCASKNEMSRIKESIIEMKKHGDKKDVRTYMQAAQAALEVLVRYENFDRDDKPSGMLDLFVSLLPKARQADVQRLCLRIKLRQSQFNECCKLAINEAEYRSLIGRVTSLLLSVHCLSSNAHVDASEGSAYLRDCKPILETLQNHGGVETVEQGKATLFELFLRLLPARLRIPTKTMLKNIQSIAKIEKIKAIEKARTGEGAIETYRFVRPEGKKPSFSHQGREQKAELTPEIVESQKSMEAALMQAEVLNRAKRDRIEKLNDETMKASLLKNPYSTGGEMNLSENNVAQSNTSVSTKDPVNKQQAKKPRLDEDSKSDTSGALVDWENCEDSEGKPSDPIAQCLRDVESDSYMKSAFGGAIMKRKIQCNAPVGLKCSLCEKASKTVSRCNRRCMNCLVNFYQS